MNWIMIEGKTKDHRLINEDVAKVLNIDLSTYYRKK